MSKKHLKKGTFKKSKPAMCKRGQQPELYSPGDVRAWIDPREKSKIRGGVKFESCYIPFKDEALKRIGVEICARSTMTKDEGMHHRIVFRNKEGNEATVDCVHVAFAQLTEEGVEHVSTEHRPDLKKLLPIEDQYFALKSFVDALAQEGVQDTMIESFRRELEPGGEEPIDFNHFMRKQISEALLRIAPKETKDLSLFLLEYIVADREEMMRSEFVVYLINKTIPYFTKEDLIRLNDIDGGIKSLDIGLQGLIIKNKNLPKEILETLTDPRLLRQLASEPDLSLDAIVQFSKHSDARVREALASTLHLKRAFLDHETHEILDEVLRKLATDEDATVRYSLTNAYPTLQRIPEDVIEKLARDENFDVRRNITSKKILSDDVIRTLSNDEDDKVRLEIAQREDLPEDVVKRLYYDLDNSVRSQVRELVTVVRGGKPFYYKSSFQPPAQVPPEPGSLAELEYNIKKSVDEHLKYLTPEQMKKEALTITEKSILEFAEDEKNINTLEEFMEENKDFHREANEEMNSDVYDKEEFEFYDDWKSETLNTSLLNYLSRVMSKYIEEKSEVKKRVSLIQT